MEYFIECSRQFLAAARDNGWPLDFFSYHSYSEPKEALRQIRFADEHLTEYGFTREKTERHFNEWLPYVSHDNLGTALQAAGIAAELIGLQNGPCDLACIYDARCGLGNYSPLFNPLTYKPHKAYYAFTAFNDLRKLGTAVRTTSDNKDVWAAAAKCGGAGALMVANDSDRTVHLDLGVAGFRATCHRLTDGRCTDEKRDGMPSELAPHAFCVILFERP